MSLLITPGQHSQRAQLYHQLGQLTAAGIGIPQAIEIQQRSPPARSYRQPLGIVVEQLGAGATFSDALQSTGTWLPPFDAALLHAGEQSGRLPSSFRLLAEHYEQNAALVQKTISSLIYPAVVFHIAIFLTPLPDLVRTGNIFVYAAKTLGVLAPVYALVGFVILSLQSPRAETTRSTLEKVLGRIPLFGKARRNLALARLASALEALISAGVPILQAWELAATASGSPALRRAVFRWKPLLESGVTPAEALRQTPEFPELFTNLYHTGEVTGSLEDTLRRIHTLYQEEGSRQLRAVAEWTPKLVYFGVVALVAWQVIRFWTGYFGDIQRAIDF